MSWKLTCLSGAFLSNVLLEGCGIRARVHTSFLQVNDYLQTTNRNIYAVGDVCTQYHFTHVAGETLPILLATLILEHCAWQSAIRASEAGPLASREPSAQAVNCTNDCGRDAEGSQGFAGKSQDWTPTDIFYDRMSCWYLLSTGSLCADFMARLVIRNALFFGSGKMSSLLIPWVTYTDPEVAHVGLYEVRGSPSPVTWDPKEEGVSCKALPQLATIGIPLQESLKHPCGMRCIHTTSYPIDRSSPSSIGRNTHPWRHFWNCRLCMLPSLTQHVEERWWKFLLSATPENAWLHSELQNDTLASPHYWGQHDLQTWLYPPQGLGPRGKPHMIMQDLLGLGFSHQHAEFALG